MVPNSGPSLRSTRKSSQSSLGRAWTTAKPPSGARARPDREGHDEQDRRQQNQPPPSLQNDGRDDRSGYAQQAADWLLNEAPDDDKPFLLVVSLMNPHNICEWARRGAGREQRLSCGEIGT